MRLGILIFILLAVSFSGFADQLDVSSTPADLKLNDGITSGALDGAAASISQTFTAGLSGRLTGINLLIIEPQVSNSLELQKAGAINITVLDAASSLQLGSTQVVFPQFGTIESWTVPNPNVGTSIFSVFAAIPLTQFISLDNVFVTAGTQYNLQVEFSGDKSQATCCDVYWIGRYAPPLQEQFFQTYVDPTQNAQVPEPPSFWLIAIGLLMLVAGFLEKRR